MLNADDPGTFFAVKELRKLVETSPKPLVIWLGAGVSKWLGYPLWKEFARDIRRDFQKNVANFDNDEAVRLIEASSFPVFFQQCRDLDRARYFSVLSQAFLPRPITAMYERLVTALAKIAPVRILTTNIDEALEQRFPGAALFQQSDIKGAASLLLSGDSFIVKLHGTRSAIESAVFTAEDYRRLEGNEDYIDTLKQIFSSCTVVFLGYGVGDKYVVDLLSCTDSNERLGNGPHFVVSSEVTATTILHRINYSLKRFADHRSALTVLDVIQQVKARQSELGARVEVVSPRPVEVSRQLGGETAFFISDFMPPGTWNTSTTAQFLNGNGVACECTVGLGLTPEEIPFRESTAPHDLLVGLICFDVVHLPLAALHRVQSLLGDAVRELLSAGVLRFVHSQHEPAIVSQVGDLFGDVGLISLSGGAETPDASIRRQLTPIPGKEIEAERFFEEIKARVISFDDADRIELAALVRGSLMMPDVAYLLGIGEAIVPSQVPPWLIFPYLRMAHLVHTGALCDLLGIQSCKIPFGGQRLLSAAFGIQSADESAAPYASYVLTGRFDTDVGSLLLTNPLIVKRVLHFRESPEGTSFRREVRDQLLTNAANEFTASVNAGLSRNIPIQTLQKARDQLSSLFTEGISNSPVPAVWANSLLADDSTRFWREKSRIRLLNLARERGVSKDGLCICGSGDKLRLCCLPPLKG
jgi:SIR2-like domain